MMLKNIKPRMYQQLIFGKAVQQNTLVVLPTGLGKTLIALMLATARLQSYPNSKILFLAPTRPLVEQHFETFSNISEFKHMNIFNGLIKPEKRQELFEQSQIIFSTPQTIENDVVSNKINLSKVSLIIFDEAHRATGDYAYTFIAKQYDKEARYPRVLALTASPGSDKEKIKEVCDNLFIEHIEVRTTESEDVKPYVFKNDIKWVDVEFPPDLKRVKTFLDDSLKTKQNLFGILGFSDLKSVASKMELLNFQKYILFEISQGSKTTENYTALSLISECIKVLHALELLETQGLVSLRKYMDKIISDGKTSKAKAVKNILADENFKSAIYLVQNLSQETNHPKTEELIKLLKQNLNVGQKAIVFNHYRDSATYLELELNKAGFSSNVFVGQAKKSGSGLSQKKQKEMLDSFRNGEFQVLISTSVGEEGLDIPEVDLVIFYEPIPSAIRTVQRQGRTGRHSEGKVFVLVTKGTRDEIFRWSSFHKEKRMYRALTDLKQTIVLKDQSKDLTLDSFREEKLSIYADHREKASGLLKELKGLDLNIKLNQLGVADYVLSNKCAVEFKTAKDFVDSIVDGRLLSQIKDLKKNYEKPVLIIMAQEDIYSQRNVHQNAISGMVATITLDFGVSVIFTKSYYETANLLKAMLKHEKELKSGEVSLHYEKSSKDISAHQEYVIASFPNIGPTLAKPLLKEFKTIKGIINATSKDLQRIDNVGPKKAERILNLIDKEYIVD